MSTQIQQIRFFHGRKHEFRRPKTSLVGLTQEQIYARKQAQRRERAEEAERNEKIGEYIEWIIDIQRRLGLSNADFAQKLGFSSQTIKLWKRKSGHYPSKLAFKRLLELEKEARIQVTILKIRYGVRM